MLGLKGLKIGIQVKLLNNTTNKPTEVTMSNKTLIQIIYKNCILLTNHNELKQLNTKVYKIVEL